MVDLILVVQHAAVKHNQRMKAVTRNLGICISARSCWQTQLNIYLAHNPNLSLDNPYPAIAPAPRVSRYSAYHA